MTHTFYLLLFIIDVTFTTQHQSVLKILTVLHHLPSGEFFMLLYQIYTNTVVTFNFLRTYFREILIKSKKTVELITFNYYLVGF